MSCGRWEQSIFLHAHAQLEGAARLLVDSHLESCDTCRARWARWVVEKDALRRTFSPLPETGLEANRLMDVVGARIRSERRNSSGTAVSVPARRAPAPRRSLALVCAALVAGIALSATAAVWMPLPHRDGWFLPGGDLPGSAQPVGLLGPEGCAPGERPVPPQPPVLTRRPAAPPSRPGSGVLPARLPGPAPAARCPSGASGPGPCADGHAAGGKCSSPPPSGQAIHGGKQRL